MKNIFLILILAILIGCQEKIAVKISKGNIVFSDSLQQTHLKKRLDSSAWDIDIFNSDLASKNERSTGPFTLGIFPEPRYDLIGNGTFMGLGKFGYTGSGKYYKRIEDKIILYNSFFVKKNKLNENRLGDRIDDIFFQIIVLTDSIDSLNYTHLGGAIISRNHPDYVGQGFYKTKNNKIDYVAFITPNSNSYAIVNTRLFDLNFGKTVLIAPQKDGSLRSLQIESPDLSSKEIEDFTDQLLKEERVMDFFTKPGNI